MFDQVAMYRQDITVTLLDATMRSSRAIVDSLDAAYALIDARNAHAFVIRKGTKILDRKM